MPKLPITINNSDPQHIIFMLEALAEAQKAALQNEVPVGAVITLDNTIIARSFNQVESRNDATSHSELLALRQASEFLQNWRLDQCSLYVTLEPCAMCLGAIRLARIKRLIIGTSESRMGAIGKFPELASDSSLGPAPEIISGILQQECGDLLKTFFKDLRKK